MAEPLKAILFGAGARGAESYAPYALDHPDQIRFVAVAEPRTSRRESFASQHASPEESCFDTWQQALESEIAADVVINCTQDQMHAESSIPALQAGYDMLLEKPIADSLEDAISIIHAAEQADRYLQICHVLRFSDFFKKIKSLLDENRLGQVITISHRENVASWHMAHSFVRGNWRSEALSSPMILAKCCHDLDLLTWFTGEAPHTLSSFGSLAHFRPENAPQGAPQRCTDGCPVEESCPYYAPAIYIDLVPFKYALSQSRIPLYKIVGGQSLKHPEAVKSISNLIPPLRELTEYKGWPRSVVSDDPGDEQALLKALREGPYGRCVYHCDNDVVDQQIVTMEFPGGITASLTMHGHSHEEGRTLRIDGAQASLLAKFSFHRSFIEIHDHRSMEVEVIEYPSNVEQLGHGGGDFGIMRDFVCSIQDRNHSGISARDSLESHFMAFAAEQSRLDQTKIDMAEFRGRSEASARPV
ncbi:MAG: Gfo/Idh/MocA family oxidoreductase [Anaerolineales bacterium]|nr:Gfo/Idh/MocA family oxidoreductase [Anaerolineales bacterium]